MGVEVSPPTHQRKLNGDSLVLHLNGMLGARVVLGAFASGSLAFCAQATTNDPTDAASEPPVQIARICQTVVRVRRGEAHYDACVSSLSDSLRSASDDRTAREARDDCLAKGLPPGGADPAECVLQASGGKPTSSTSYFYASPREVSRRVRLSCARLGFDPANGAFTNCVSDLATALDTIDAPD